MMWCGSAASAARRAATLAVALLGLLSANASGQGTECEEDQREVRALEFHGNFSFRSADLAQRVTTTPSDLTRRLFRVAGARRCLDSDELRLDVARLRVFYRRRGYFQTVVDTSVVAMGDGGARVTFEIQEGEPVRVDTLRISGLDTATAPIAMVDGLGLQRGVVFDVERLQQAIDSIKTRLRNNGYPRGDVAASYAVFDSAARRARVTLEVIPGARSRVGEIRIFHEPLGDGPLRVGAGTIRRLLGVREGDVYRERSLGEGQRALYQSDLFQHVDVTLAARPPATTDSLVAIDVRVRESYLRQVDTEVGWAVLDCFKARAQLTDKNFLGNARRLELTAQVSKVGWGAPTRLAQGVFCAPSIQADTFSARLNYFAGATLRLPSLFALPTSPSLSVYSERRGEYQAFLRTTLLGGETAVSMALPHEIPLRLAYSLEYGRTEAQPALLCAVFNRCDSESRALITERNRPLAVASAHVERIRTDNPINPRVGTALRLDVRGASRQIGSDPDIQFLKGLSDASVYRGIVSGATVAARLRLGTVLGRTLSFEDAVGFIPPEERLYAGGAGSVRGYQQNELGELIYIAEDAPTRIAGTGDTVYFEVPGDRRPRRVVPVGGSSLVVANVELRMRSFYYPELVQFTLFADAGDVWQRDASASGRVRRALSLNGLRWTPGIGVRVFTPVGPFQANVGYNPHARPAGAIYYDQAPDAQGFAPLYCVSPGNRVPAVPGRTPGSYEQLPGRTCPATFVPSQSRTFLSRLTFTFSIGPDF
ncbi:MAG: BamA/TamA family outer membrane protein [Gemmatimonadaceae bacterium]|nr:BamA/TamA family outer membrane protein [Gemmatimonadaceae bacterium]